MIATARGKKRGAPPERPAVQFILHRVQGSFDAMPVKSNVLRITVSFSYNEWHGYRFQGLEEDDPPVHISALQR